MMLLAKSEDMLRRLQAIFRHHKVVKKYWVITVGVPDPPSGVIDMPMSEAGKITVGVPDPPSGVIDMPMSEAGKLG